MWTFRDFKISDNFQEELIRWLYEITEDDETYYDFRLVFQPSSSIVEGRKLRRISFIQRLAKHQYNMLLEEGKPSDEVQICVSDFDEVTYNRIEKRNRWLGYEPDTDLYSDEENLEITKDGRLIPKQ